MEIDWITVSAQIVNFLILVWLLKRFLYQPVIKAMDQREQRISDRLNEAQQREQQADEKIQQYQNKSGELEQNRDEILKKAREKAEQEKKKLLEEARAAVREQRDNWQRQASDEKAEFLGNLRHQAADAIQALASKALGDLADSDLEGHIVQAFITRLKSLDKETRKALAQTSEPVHISSAFELDSTVRGRLTRAIHEHLAEDIEMEYTQSPDLLCGIKLSSGDRQLSWNLADYMEELTARVEAAFSPIETRMEESQ
jgi:F-type H+-transporting ATPase subunit b